MSWAIKEGLGVQCAKALGRASVGECVTGISWGDEIERRGTWGTEQIMLPPAPSKPRIDRTHKEPIHASSAKGPPLDFVMSHSTARCVLGCHKAD